MNVIVVKESQNASSCRGSSKAGSPRARVIGITGGVAAGKSTIARMLASLGAEVIDADEIAHAVLASPRVRERLRANWGEAVFDSHGLPDREKIAAAVFRKPKKLEELNGWVHPPTRREMRARLDRALQTDTTPLVVIDAPLLVEAKLDRWCDTIAFVAAPRSTRAERAGRSRGWDPAEIERREASQNSLHAKRRSADVVIGNYGSTEETFAQVKRLYQQWTQGLGEPFKSSGGKKHG